MDVKYKVVREIVSGVNKGTYNDKYMMFPSDEAAKSYFDATSTNTTSNVKTLWIRNLETKKIIN